MNVDFGMPWVLAFLALALIPLFRQPAQLRTFPWLQLLPATGGPTRWVTPCVRCMRLRSRW